MVFQDPTSCFIIRQEELDRKKLELMHPRCSYIFLIICFSLLFETILRYFSHMKQVFLKTSF